MLEQRKVPKANISAKISNDVKDYGKDPVFVKRADESKAFLEKNGFPKELLKRR